MFVVKAARETTPKAESQKPTSTWIEHEPIAEKPGEISAPSIYHPNPFLAPVGSKHLHATVMAARKNGEKQHNDMESHRCHYCERRVCRHHRLHWSCRYLLASVTAGLGCGNIISLFLGYTKEKLRVARLAEGRPKRNLGRGTMKE